MIISYSSSKFVFNLCFVVFFVVFLSAKVQADGESRNIRALEDLREILKHRSTLRDVKKMLDTLYNDFNDMHKRACLVGGGMFHGCDYKDILEGTQDQNHYAFRAPGRKRRSLSSTTTSSSSSSSSSPSSSLLKTLFQTRRK